MRLETLTRIPAAELPPDPKEIRIEVAGGKVGLTYHPVRAKEATGNVGEQLEAALLAWDVTDENGDLLPVNADSIHALSPTVKETLLTAIQRPKSKDAPKIEKPVEEAKVELKPTGHGSFEPVAEKETKSGSK